MFFIFTYELRIRFLSIPSNTFYISLSGSNEIWQRSTHKYPLVTVSFTNISTVKTVCDQQVYTHFHTHCPYLFSDWMTFGVRDMHKMLFIFKTFLNSCAREAVIFYRYKCTYIYTFHKQHDFFKVKNATSQSATFVTLILK
jgi:hypothetical protein